MLHPFWAFFFQRTKKKPPFSAVSAEEKSMAFALYHKQKNRDGSRPFWP
ncbi:hypothetical protein AB434_1924 [Heyndrickxia coagulans]|nr:hypothetical protein AB434_1924 [Heyndrickxia coagulans]